MDEVYRGWVLGVGGKPKASNTIHKETNYNAVSSETATVNLVGRDGRQQQFDTTCSPINAPQWLHIPWTVVVIQGQQNTACESRPGHP